METSLVPTGTTVTPGTQVTGTLEKPQSVMNVVKEVVETDDGGLEDNGVENRVDDEVEDNGVDDDEVEDNGVDDGEVEDNGVDDGEVDNKVEDGGLEDNGVEDRVEGDGVEDDEVEDGVEN
ncbi:hypothetical protein PP714_08175 [Lacticaseibacillus paracasei]|nr:hypothetical protein [Lacticaseibacillus paracasei]